MVPLKPEVDWKANARGLIFQKFVAAAVRIERSYRQKYPATDALVERAMLDDPNDGEILRILEEARERGLEVPPPPSAQSSR